MASFKMTGLDNLQKELKKFEKKIENLNGTDGIPLNDLLTRAFMLKYTSFSSADELLKAGGFNVESQSDFKSIPQDKLDKHIAANTKFKNWESMLREATAQYVSKKLGH